jgi:hypothetical protein
MAAGTVTITEQTWGTVKKITGVWTAGTAGEAGTASGTTAGVYSGEVRRLVTVPAVAPDAPDDNYSVTALDSDGVDVLMGAAVTNRDEAATEQVNAANLGIVANSKLTIAIAAAGSATKGTVHIYIR